ncbi:hypothetical protein COT75_04620 [Candidatus Beckwithbacteria bacterium CG10_big_fil_rev_8_21_14_0_10_34_10]|uniref:S1 motif domain-containing protein n=1 Tax=Candidatus Beckwithbacteria bacterium CG10_big_fil_rev_8_21_14_0_10_34_10 TaxID=1974495 RepID=A0A2H0W7V7_9BACT|nr:MAG: hypothetical protein COT75_04620 [Candidatus Beckwithbacteria bacterium CG10_big_fil_rev_8_21_14_0_10_34_10]
MTKSTTQSSFKKKKSTQKKKIPLGKKPSPAKNMEELMAQSGIKLHGLKKGQEIEGTITDIIRRTVLVDIGAKTEGIVIDKEYEVIKDFLSTVKIGDKVKIIIVSPENDKGQILLSLRQAAMEYKWGFFEQYLKTGEAVEVRGLEVNRGGLIARLMGVRGFVPASQLGRKYLGRPDNLQNKVFKVKIIEVDREKNRLIFSEKEVSEAEALAAKKESLKNVKLGKTYEGKVSGIMPFGIFVQVEDKELFLDGLVHISEISWERVDNLNNLYKVGDKIKVKVLGIDKSSAKLNLSIKQLGGDPWEKIAKNYPKDKKTKGTVSRLVAFGAFVKLELGIEGLVHISKIPADYNIKVGDKVDVYVEELNLEKRRMSLGLVLKEKPVGYK